jgi:Ran GTPase-activating protein (RanGAP) involved in mRNA processing and transport
MRHYIASHCNSIATDAPRCDAVLHAAAASAHVRTLRLNHKGMADELILRLVRDARTHALAHVARARACRRMLHACRAHSRAPAHTHTQVPSFARLSQLHLYLLNDGHVPALAQLLAGCKARLHAVHLHQARISSRLAVDVIHAIRSQSRLRVLCLKGVRLESDSAALLATLVAAQPLGRAFESSGLERLELHSNCMDDDLCALLFDAALRTCERLHALAIHHNRVGAKACAALASAVQQNSALQRSLRCVTVRGSALLPDGLEQLSAAAAAVLRLEHFVVGESTVDERGMRALSPALRASRQLEALDCADCSLRCSAAVELLEALHAHPQLRSLDISHNPLGPQVRDRCRCALPAMLHVACAVQLHTSLSRFLVRPPPHLQVLKLERIALDATCYDWNVATALSRLRVSELHLSANRIGQQGATMLAEALTGCTKRFVEYAAALHPSSLRPFGPANCAWLDKNHVASLCDLKVLNVSENRLLGVGGTMVLWALQWRAPELNLEHLDVSNNLFGACHSHIQAGLEPLVPRLACSNSSEGQVLDAANQV